MGLDWSQGGHETGHEVCQAQVRRQIQRPTEGNDRFKIPDLVKRLHWTRGRNEASPTPLRLQGCSTTQGNLPRLLLGRTRLQHQASLKSVSVRLQVARSAAFSTSSVSAVAIRTACSPRLDTIYIWRAVPYPGTDLSRQWRPATQTW